MSRYKVQLLAAVTGQQGVLGQGEEGGEFLMSFKSGHEGPVPPARVSEEWTPASREKKHVM